MIQQKSNIIFLRLMSLVVILIALVLFSSCAGLKVTTVDRISYKPACKKAWKGKTIFIDFDTNRSVWYHSFASNLSSDIKDRLIEDIVEDGCFHVQDRFTGKRYAYKVGVRIANPLIKVRNGIIRRVSAAFRIKTYDSNNNLITAKTRKVEYDAPPFVVSLGDSQVELLENYAYNVSVKIRGTVYQSFK